MPPKKNANAKGPKTGKKGDDDGKGKEKKGGTAVKVSFILTFIFVFKTFYRDTQHLKTSSRLIRV